MKSFQDILFDKGQGIATITLNRPDKLNAWTPQMQASIKRALVDCANDDNVRAIIITGAGRGFCAGADMAGLQKINPESWSERDLARADETIHVGSRPDLGPDVSADFKGRFGYLMSIKKPIIAAINGPCAGIGLVFALFCDMRFASSLAVFTTAFAQRGLIAEHGISWLLPKIVGVPHALDLLFSARKVGAPEAERLGLINRAIAHENFLEEVKSYANHLVTNVSPRSMAVMKAQVWKALFQSLDEAVRTGDQEMQKSFATEDFKEGVAHFVEKRAANFTGR